MAAHGVAAHVTGARARAPSRRMRRSLYSVRPVAPRGGRDIGQGPAPLDHAAISHDDRRHHAGAVPLGSPDKRSQRPLCRRSARRPPVTLPTCPAWSLLISWQRRRRHRSSASSPISTRRRTVAVASASVVGSVAVAPGASQCRVLILRPRQGSAAAGCCRLLQSNHRRPPLAARAPLCRATPLTSRAPASSPVSRADC
mgnify:CR=1 FL=1